MEDVVARIRLSYPLLKACKLDFTLRQLCLAHLVEMNQREGQGLLVPKGFVVQ